MYIEVDLSNYEDDVKEYYCNGNCLMKYAGQDFTEKFKHYIDDLDKEIYIYKKPRTQEQILRDLKDLYYRLV